MHAAVSYVVRLFLYMALKQARVTPHSEYDEALGRAAGLGERKRAKLLHASEARFIRIEKAVSIPDDDDVLDLDNAAFATPLDFNRGAHCEPKLFFGGACVHVLLLGVLLCSRRHG